MPTQSGDGSARPASFLRRFVSTVFGLAVLLIGVVLPAGTANASPVVVAGGTVSHWGSFFGNGSADNDLRTSPTPIALPGTVVQVATSNSTQYALLSDGSVYAWGLGGDGELGDGSTSDSFTTAVRVQFPSGVTIASLPVDAMPYNTGLAIDSTGQAWGWGDNSAGQLCLGSSGVQTTPVRIPLTDVTAMAGAGDPRALLLRRDPLRVRGQRRRRPG